MFFELAVENFITDILELPIESQTDLDTIPEPPPVDFHAEVFDPFN